MKKLIAGGISGSYINKMLAHKSITVKGYLGMLQNKVKVVKSSDLW